MTLIVNQAFTKGLLAGYAGQTQFTKLTRGSFPLVSSHFTDDNLTYHDEWLSARQGGGQELLAVNGQRYTRLYAGGVVTEKELQQLGITEKDVIEFLKQSILEQKENTRLFTACQPPAAGDWQYAYLVIDQDPTIPTTIGKEVITYQKQTVFVHTFLLSPIATA